MQCDGTGQVIGAYLDQELDPTMRREVAAHLASCVACTALAAELQRAGRQVAALGRERAPRYLMSDVREGVAKAPAGTRLLPWLPAVIRHPPVRLWLGRVAALFLLCA